MASSNVAIDMMIGLKMSIGQAMAGSKTLTSSFSNLNKKLVDVQAGLDNSFGPGAGAKLKGIYNNNNAITELGKSMKITGEHLNGINGERFKEEILKNKFISISETAGLLNNSFEKVGLSLEGLRINTSDFAVGLDAMQNVMSSKELTKFNDQLTSMSENYKYLSEKQQPKYLELQIELGRQLQDLTQLQVKYNSNRKNGFKDASKMQDNILKEIELTKENIKTTIDLTSAVTDNAKAQQAWADKIGGFVNSKAMQLFGNMVRLAGAYGAFQDVASSHTEAARSINQMALSYGNAEVTITNYMDKAQDVAFMTGRMAAEGVEAMNELANIRVSKNIDELARLSVTTLRLGNAFNMSTGEAAQFIKQLKLTGGLGVEDIESIGNELANVQDQLGLSSQEFSEATNTIAMMTGKMKAFGNAAPKDVAAVSREVGIMTAAFSASGIEISEVGRLMGDMMDPSKIQDNVLLYSKLGMTASDAFAMMSGDGSKMTGMTEKMRDMSKDMLETYKNSPLALQKIAEMHGLSVENVRKLASLTDEQITLNKEMADLEEQSADVRSGFNESLKILMTRLNYLIAKFLTPIVDLLNKALKPLTAMTGAASDVTEKTAGWLKVLKGVGGALTLLTLLAGPAILGKVLKGSIGLFSKMGGAIMANVTKTKMFQNTLGKLKIPGVDKGKSPMTSFFESMSKVKPAQVLAVSVAILAIGLAISAIVLSLAQLATAMKGMDWTEMVGMGAMLIIIFVGMAYAIGAVGIAAAAGAGPLLAVAVAVLMIGLAVSGIILSLALLVKVMSGAGDQLGIMGLVFMQMAIGVIALAGALLMMASMGPAVAIGLAVLVAAFAVLALGMWLLKKPLLSVGEGFLMLGTGIALIATNGLIAMTALFGLRDVVGELNGSDFGSNIAKQINLIAEAMSNVAAIGSPTIQAMSMITQDITGRPEQSAGSETEASSDMGLVVDAINETNTILRGMNTDIVGAVGNVTKELRKAPRVNNSFNFGK